MSSTKFLSLFSAANVYVSGLLAGGDATRSVLPFVPRSLRIFLVLLLILNSRSLPFTWHLRVFRPVLYVRLKWLSLLFSPKRSKDAFLDSLCAQGKSPFALRSVYNTWASPDESDYNMHLSNSSYAKVLDMLRLKFALAHMSTVFRDGCWIALGATHLRFVREIPIGTNYEIRMYCGSWDNKWLYVVSRYVSKKKPSSTDSKTRKRLQDTSSALQSQAQSASSSTGDISSAMAFPQLHTPASGDISSSGSTTPNPNASAVSSEDAFDSLWTEAPDETLHCVAVNEVCFKSGRVTVPPVFMLAAAGCGLDAEQWERVRRLRDMRGGKKGGEEGKEKNIRELARGAWKDVPLEERWWEDALRPFEAERVRRLTVLKGMREGLESARFL